MIFVLRSILLQQRNVLQAFYICCIKARIIMFYGFYAGIIIIICYLFSQVHHFAKCTLLITVREKNEMCYTFHSKFGIHKIFLKQKRCFTDAITIFCLFWLQFQWLSHSFIVRHFLFTSRWFSITDDVVKSTNFPVSKHVITVDHFGAVWLVNRGCQILTFKTVCALVIGLNPKPINFL